MLPSLARAPTGALLALALLLSACSGYSAREGVTPRQAHMYAHFDRAGELHDALVRGSLDGAKEAARWIGDHPEDEEFTGESARFQDATRAFATEVERSTTLADATHAAARMGQACGDCHRLNQVEPRFLMGTAPPSGSGPQAEMALHVWASERMWAGLIGPGDRAWAAGAGALKSGWFDTRKVVADPGDRTRLHELARQVYDLGESAGHTTDPDQRAELYGDFLNTCTECHQLTETKIG